MSADHFDVLIVGAGPVGLFCANELTRQGLQCRIIEKKSTLSDKSKALAIHIRSLDLLEDCGFFDEVLGKGLRIEGLLIKSKEKLVVSSDFSILEANHHFLIDLPQDQTELILYEGLRQKGLEVVWNSELTGIEQQSNQVKASVKKADGSIEIIEANWVIACDGSHSTLRHLVDAQFIGSNYHQTWWLADLLIDWDMPPDKMVAYISDEGPLVCFPIGNKRYRLVMTAPEKIASREPTLAEIEQIFQRRCSDKATLSDPLWLSPFGIAHKQIEKYRFNRVFFAGDAAHVHSPMGGQGLNTGLQDVYNLAWKLAMVHKGLAKEELLDSYHIERHPIAKSVLRKTGFMTQLIMLKNTWLIGLRNHFMKLITSFPSVKQAILRDIAELDIRYTKSPVMTVLGDKTNFRIGEFLNDFSLLSLQSHEEKLLRHIIQGTAHHLFLFAGLDNSQQSPLFETALLIEKHYKGLIKTHLVLTKEKCEKECHSSIWLDSSLKVHNNFAIREPIVLLIRPDKYVCLTQAPLNKDELLLHLEKSYINKTQSGLN